MTNRGGKQKTSSKNNRKGTPLLYCRVKNRDSVLIFDRFNKKALSSPMKISFHIWRENDLLNTKSVKRI